jgi:hypothetical protein
MCIAQAHTWCEHVSLFKIIGNWKKYSCINPSRVCEHCLQKFHKVSKREKNEGVNDWIQIVVSITFNARGNKWNPYAHIQTKNTIHWRLVLLLNRHVFNHGPSKLFVLEKFTDVYVGLLGSINDNCVLQKFSVYKQTQYKSLFNIQNGSHSGVFLWGIPCSIGWWSHIKTMLNKLFWKIYIIGDIRKAYMLLKNQLVFWKTIHENFFTKKNFMWHLCLTCLYVIVSCTIWYLVEAN